MMNHCLRLSLWLVLAAGLSATARADDGFFAAKVRPVLAGTCVRCHGGAKTKGGLRLDSRDALLKGGEHGPAIVPGDPDKSLLVQAVRHAHDEIKMPPDKRLPDGVVNDLAAWVKDGAAWPKGVAVAPAPRAERRWAFAPVGRIEPPADPDGW